MVHDEQLRTLPKFKTMLKFFYGKKLLSNCVYHILTCILASASILTHNVVKV